MGKHFSMKEGPLKEHRTQISQERGPSGGSGRSQDLLVVVDVGLHLGDDVERATLARQLSAFGVHRRDVLQQRHVPDEVVQLVHRVAAVPLFQRPEGRGVVAVAAAAAGELTQNCRLEKCTKKSLHQFLSSR